MTFTGSNTACVQDYLIILLVLGAYSVSDLYRFKNVQFEIASTETSGTFDLNAKFMGVSMEKVDLVFQVLISDVFIEEALTEHAKKPDGISRHVAAVSCVQSEWSLIVPHGVNIDFARRGFSFAAPSVFSSLPDDVRDCLNVNVFKILLKTFLFNRTFKIKPK
jgi:hypothetical protein